MIINLEDIYNKCKNSAITKTFDFYTSLQMLKLNYMQIELGSFPDYTRSVVSDNDIIRVAYEVYNRS